MELSELESVCSSKNTDYVVTITLVNILKRIIMNYKDLRTGMSTAWLQIKHPLGFILEINGKAFSKICSTISMNNGIITTQCRFSPELKNATLEVQNVN